MEHLADLSKAIGFCAADRAMFRERRRIHVINPKLSASRATADTHAQGTYLPVTTLAFASGWAPLFASMPLAGSVLCEGRWFPVANAYKPQDEAHLWGTCHCPAAPDDLCSFKSDLQKAVFALDMLRTEISIRTWFVGMYNIMQCWFSVGLKT